MRVLKTSRPAKFTDPVRGMQVDPAQSLYAFIYQKKSYYFCADAYLKSFKKDPDKFQKLTPVNVKTGGAVIRRGWKRPLAAR